MLKTRPELKPKYNLYFPRKSKLTFGELKDFYIAPKDYFKIGVEYERLSLDKHTYSAAPYENVSKVISHFASVYNWNLVYDGDTIIGAQDFNRNSISLEPGMQLEISLAPSPYLPEIKNGLTKIASSLDSIAKIYDVIFLGYGVNPYDSVDEIRILNKKRYKIMDKYLPYAYGGELAQKMMKMTAGIQINIDYFSNFDLYNKLYLANIVMPFVQGLSSNSPFENNSLNDYKSSRAYIWRHTGKERCNFFYKNIFKNPLNRFDPIKAYIKEVLKVPMIYIERLGENIAVNGKMNFLEYIKAKDGYFDFYPNYDDYVLHQSLCFPDIRLKQYIEIRNHDSSDINMVMALCALYKGIFIENVKKTIDSFKDIKLNEIDNYSYNSAKYGLDFKLNRKTDAWNIIQRLLNIAKENLNSQERMYLYPVEQMLLEKKTKADKIVELHPKNHTELINLLNNIN